MCSCNCVCYKLFCRKAEELLRLFNLKNRVSINEVAKMVLSINCAATLLGVDFDNDVALTMSGLNRKDYTRQLNLFKSLVDLNNMLDIVAVCIKLQLPNNVPVAAKKLLAEYTKELREQSDIKKPQYVAMAIFMAAKPFIKVNKLKNNLREISQLTTVQWASQEEFWTKWMDEKKPLSENGYTAQQEAMDTGEIAADIVQIIMFLLFVRTLLNMEFVFRRRY